MASAGSAAPIERYVVLEFLSEGGMGAIYLGKKMGAGGFEKEVVLNQLLPEFTAQPEFIDLFVQMNELLIQDMAVIPLVQLANPVAVGVHLRGYDFTAWDVEVWDIADWYQ